MASLNARLFYEQFKCHLIKVNFFKFQLVVNLNEDLG